MSHFKERKEKNCLNCGALVQGRYCGKCGQENIEPRESAWHLVTHFFYDITHFDGKFFSAVKYLLLRPGFLTAEYVKGRRASYLHPIRMYVFTSAFFFLIYFSFFNKHEEIRKAGVEGLKEELISRKEGLKGLQEVFAKTRDSVLKNAAGKAIPGYETEIRTLSDSLILLEALEIKKMNVQKVITDSLRKNVPGAVKPILDSLKNVPGVDSDSSGVILTVEEIEWYKNEDAYLAVQHELPEKQKDGFFVRTFKVKLLRWHEEDKRDQQKSRQLLMEKFKHTFPAILFISLPFFAFFLKLLYIRRSKFYYVDHGIFAIHTYCALFILMLLYYTIDASGDRLHWRIFPFMEAVLIVYMLFYVFKAMRNFYGQGRAKTLLKYFLLSGMTLIVMIILLLASLVVSVYKV